MEQHWVMQQCAWKTWMKEAMTRQTPKANVEMVDYETTDDKETNGKDETGPEEITKVRGRPTISALIILHRISISSANWESNEE